MHDGRKQEPASQIPVVLQIENLVEHSAAADGLNFAQQVQPPARVKETAFSHRQQQPAESPQTDKEAFFSDLKLKIFLMFLQKTELLFHFCRILPQRGCIPHQHFPHSGKLFRYELLRQDTFIRFVHNAICFFCRFRNLRQTIRSFLGKYVMHWPAR